MSTGKPRRNDPCPCGSGKKYKHCCKRRAQERRRTRPSSPASHLGQEDAIQWQLAQIRSMGQAIMRHVPPDEAQALQQLLDQAEEAATYEAMSDEIEAAAQALEAHRAEFEAMMGDVNVVADRARRLFSEDRFMPFRYTAADVYRAFEAVGYPQRYQEDSSENTETLVAAILHLADRDRRLHLARQLMMLLPEYVSAERYLDAWLIQYCAFQTLEAPEQSNPFLAEMFHYGFVEWANQVEAQQEALLRELGIDRAAVAGMSVDELEAWLRAQMADPAKKAQVEAYYAAHPMMSDQAEAEFRELERGALLLLERDDANCLYLSPEEVDPWIPAVMERLKPFETQTRQAAERGSGKDPGIIRAMGNVLVEVAREMVPAVFTPERLGRLIADLRDYRRSLLEAKEREAAMYANAALIMLEREDTPAENPLLIGICFASLHLMLITLAEEARARAESRATTEEAEG